MEEERVPVDLRSAALKAYTNDESRGWSALVIDFIGQNYKKVEGTAPLPPIANNSSTKKFELKRKSHVFTYRCWSMFTLPRDPIS